MTHSKPITINEHGQITIPKLFREILNSPTIVLERDSTQPNIVRLIPVPDIGGSLSEYVQNELIDFSKERENAWQANTPNEFNNQNKTD